MLSYTLFQFLCYNELIGKSLMVFLNRKIQEYSFNEFKESPALKDETRKILTIKLK